MRFVSAIAGLVVLALPAVAAPLEKIGEYDLTTCYSGETVVLQHSQSLAVVHYRVSGTARSNGPNKAWDETVFTCLGTTLIDKNVPTTTAYCEYLDGDGDRTFGRSTVEANTSRWTFLSGTGKYAGITGGGTIDQTGRFPLQRPGAIAACSRNRGSWKLP